MYIRREGEAARETLIHNVCTCMSTPLAESVILSIVSYDIGTMSQTVNSNTLRLIKNDFLSHVHVSITCTHSNKDTIVTSRPVSIQGGEYFISFYIIKR